ncbi:spore germination protein [Paenibacillus sp.]|uniref:spore germination protein n=1 Tax=Paenibacillus sp. TaxID=58172 RepID=UPI002D3D3E00|nr:spore germination protein [Paenibacillus sp.]HZG57364.1 spore germination protein [Paenibacillus sp.]
MHESLRSKLAAQFGSSKDFIHKTLRRGESSVELFYLLTIADEALIFQSLVNPFYNESTNLYYAEFISCMPKRVTPPDEAATLQLVAQGYAVAIAGSDVYVFDFRKFPSSQIREATVETVIQGPLNAFSEDIGTNVALMRQRYGPASLTMETTTVGTRIKTAVALLSDGETANRGLVEEMKRRIQAVALPVVQSAGQLTQLLGEPKRTLFPRLLVTERPDRAALNLSQGKVVVLLHGTPFAIVAPATFYDFFASMEDLYQQYFISRFLLFLRYAALLISLTLPATYVAISAYNPEILRVELALAIAGNRVAVPYPAFLEVLFMLLAMELLVEASIRLPKAIGSTATTVGGLILGQAATEASLVSSIMIIIVATVAISNFVVPINSMSFAIRVAKYALLFLATLYGLTGIVLGLIALVGYLVSLDSMGEPYLKLFEHDDQQTKPTQRSGKTGASRRVG